MNTFCVVINSTGDCRVLSSSSIADFYCWTTICLIRNKYITCLVS